MAIKGLINSDGTKVADATSQFMSTTVMPTPAEADSGKVASVQVTSNSDTGTGLDGDVTISANTVVNKYAGLTGDIALNGRTIAVPSNADFGVGDKVMIIQMQTPTVAEHWEHMSSLLWKAKNPQLESHSQLESQGLICQIHWKYQHSTPERR